MFEVVFNIGILGWNVTTLTVFSSGTKWNREISFLI